MTFLNHAVKNIYISFTIKIFRYSFILLITIMTSCNNSNNKDSESSGLSEIDPLHLKNIIVSPGELNPAFSPENTQYDIEVDAEIKTININASAKYSNTKISINGKPKKIAIFTDSIDLDFGENQIKIITSKDGLNSTRSYNIVVTRKGVVIDKDSPYAYVDPSLGTNFPLTVELGNEPSDIYFIFTNTSTTDTADAPNFKSNYNYNYSIRASKYNEEEPVLEEPQFTNGTPYITEFNNNPFKYIDKSRKLKPRSNLIPQEPRFDKAGDTTYFTNSVGKKVLATCRKVITQETAFGTKTVNIFVANNCWHSTGSKSYVINQKMVDELGNKFLKKGLSNDIYDKVTSIIGEEWGYAKYFNYIKDDDNITIFLTDIAEDNSYYGGTLGYFWSVHNFKDSNYLPVDSNERVMFFIDAVMFAKKSGTYWEITDDFPKRLIATLAHEFQHMIHFYQKTVKFGFANEVWLDEMCSMVIEDLLAYEIESNGPRGVNYWDPTSGNERNYDGRLPSYNYYNDIAVAEWPYDEQSSLKNYSINYALGSYLARNYGGASFFNKIVQRNRYNGHEAIEYALRQSGIYDDFGTILQKWATANLLSDRIDIETPYKYNNYSDWFIDDMGFRLGSINLYNYSYNGQVGPKFYTSPISKTLPKTSNRYYRVGKNLKGKRKWDIQMDPNGSCRLTVVKKAI